MSRRRPVSSTTVTKTLVKPKPGDFPTKRVGESLLRLPRKDNATVVKNTSRGVRRPDTLVLTENSEPAISSSENFLDPSRLAIREQITQKESDTVSDSPGLNELSLLLTPLPHPTKSQTIPSSDFTEKLHCDVKLSSTQRAVLSPIDNRNVVFPVKRQLSQNSEGQRGKWKLSAADVMVSIRYF